jgi:hypothetical protein
VSNAGWHSREPGSERVLLKQTELGEKGLLFNAAEKRFPYSD